MVTCGTYLKRHHFTTQARLDLLQSQLFTVAEEFGWRLQAWAILSNHYHFLASSPKDARTLSRMLSKLHTLTATAINRQDGTPGRRVWYQYWDSRITYQRSYLARLKYVHQNPVHHGLVQHAEAYPWCSAAWFARCARPSFRQTVESFKLDRLNVVDDFEPLRVEPESDSGVKPPHSKGISPAL
jgi:putative transposase